MLARNSLLLLVGLAASCTDVPTVGIGDVMVDAGSIDATYGDAAAPCGVPTSTTCNRALSQPDCVGAGGEWAPRLTSPFCLCPAGDANCPCTDSTECDGACVTLEHTVDTCTAGVGVCTRFVNFGGCFCIQGEDPGAGIGRDEAHYICVN